MMNKKELQESEYIHRASAYAIASHTAVNQMLDPVIKLPYSYHLQRAVVWGLNHINLIPELDRLDVIGGIWCHDLIEDARQTYNDVKVATGEVIAEYAYSLANEKGRNRKERANEKYYEGIRRYRHATFIKLCDRAANIEFSFISGNSKMFELYKKEHPGFKKHLKDGRYEPLWDAIDAMVSVNAMLISPIKPQ